MISAVVHTYNEENNIERCLSSITFADEIVLVDMGSTDQTLKKAVKFPVKVYHYQKTGFVEPARNFAIAKAQGDYILIVDADEEIPVKLANSLQQLVKEKIYDYFRLPRKNIIFGKWMKHSGWWPDYQTRFFRKNFVEWTDKLHGVPLTRGQGTDLDANEKASIIHYNYLTIDQYILRLNRYTSIAAKELYLANKIITYQDLINAPVQEFIRRFFMLEGYKDGLHGLAISLLQSFSELVVRLKLWELYGFKPEKILLGDYKILQNKEIGTKEYWLYYELLKSPHNLWENLIWRIRRKLNQYV